MYSNGEYFLYISTLLILLRLLLHPTLIPTDGFGRFVFLFPLFKERFSSQVTSWICISPITFMIYDMALLPFRGTCILIAIFWCSLVVSTSLEESKLLALAVLFLMMIKLMVSH
jgi:hypothetical protein